jgi:hypothetical protein
LFTIRAIEKSFFLNKEQVIQLWSGNDVIMEGKLCRTYYYDNIKGIFGEYRFHYVPSAKTPEMRGKGVQGTSPAGVQGVSPCLSLFPK